MANAPSRGGVSGRYLDSSAFQVTQSYSDPNAPPPKPVEGSNWFGPLEPMVPIAPEGVAGRQWDYPSGYNLVTLPRAYHSTTFWTLRALADGYDLLRLVIETRKDQAKRLRWTVQPKDRHTKKDVSDQIDRVTKLFKKPDGFHTWSEWVGILLEDVLVTDAPAIYKARKRGGELLYLYPIDGAILKPVIDQFGRTPLPYKDGRKTIYPVAYQHILKGYPAVDYSIRDIIYKPRNVRVHTPYGFSPVEQILATVNIALQRQKYTTSYFTEGTIPDAFLSLPDTWTPDMIEAFQQYFNQYFGGDAAHRRELKMIPAGTLTQTKEPDLKGEFDDWLARIICFAFSISPTALTKSVNRASAQSQKAQAEEEGLVPIMQWIKELVDGIIEDELDAPDVEFMFSGEDAVDESAQAVIIDGYLKNGVYSGNEARVKVGLEPIDDPAMDIPMIYTAMGMVPWKQNTVEGMKEIQEVTGALPNTQPGSSKAGGASAPKGPIAGSSSNTKPKVQTGSAETARKWAQEVLGNRSEASKARFAADLEIFMKAAEEDPDFDETIGKVEDQ
jgi:hypothetical protein